MIASPAAPPKGGLLPRPDGHCNDDAAWAEFERQYRGQPRSYSNLTDFQLANELFMADRNDLNLIHLQTAAKERIRWLSLRLAEALAAAPAPVGGGEAVAWRLKRLDAERWNLWDSDPRLEESGDYSDSATWQVQPLFASPLGGSGDGQGSRPQEAVPAEPSLPTVLALLEDARSMMRIVSDGFEDEGDRTYLGSTNHADWLLAEAEKIEAYFIANDVEPADGCSSNEGAA